MSKRTIVEVTFKDGEVQTFHTSAGIGIASYAARKMHETGSLVLWNDDEAHVIPAEEVRSVKFSKASPKKDEHESDGLG